MAYKNPYMEIPCDHCGKIFTIHKASFKRNTKNGVPKLCKSCLSAKQSKRSKAQWENMTSDERANVKKRMSQGTVKQWENFDKSKRKEINEKISKKRLAYWERLSDEEMNVVRKRKSDWWKNLDPNKKKEYEESRVIGFKEWWNSLSDGEKKQWGIDRSNYSLEWWNNATDEERLNHSLKISEARKEYWKKLSKKNYRLFCSLISDVKRAYWKNLPKEERYRQTSMLRNNWNEYYVTLSREDIDAIKDRLSKGYRQWFDSLTYDEKQEWEKNISDSLKQWWKDLSYEEFSELMFKSQKDRTANMRITDTESEFMKILDLYKIDYDFQYLVSNFSNKEFQEKFPINPYTNTERSSPHHSWDFRLKLGDIDVLVDIDGSIHAMDNNDKIYYNTIYSADYIKFKDSQRPYQSGGLDAYAVLAYNDKITADTPVIDLISEKTLKFEDFIKYLNAINT